MPLFILYGGEIVFVIIGLRITLWILRGGVHWNEDPCPPTPPPGGGKPVALAVVRQRGDDVPSGHAALRKAA